MMMFRSVQSDGLSGKVHTPLLVFLVAVIAATDLTPTVAFANQPPPIQRPIRIMALGDSISFGFDRSERTSGYRGFLSGYLGTRIVWAGRMSSGRAPRLPK